MKSGIEKYESRGVEGSIWEEKRVKALAVKMDIDIEKVNRRKISQK